MGVTARPDSPSPEEIITEATSAPSRTLGVNTSVVFAVTIAIQVIGYASSIVIAKGIATVVVPPGPGGYALGVNLWGAIQLFMIISSSLNTLGELRLSSAYTFYIARGKSPIQIARTFLVVRTAMVAVGGVTLLVLAGPLGWTPAVSGIPPTSLYEVFAVFMVLPLLWSVQTVYTATLTAKGDAVGGQMPLLLESSVRTVALIIVAYPFFAAQLHGTATIPDPTALLWEMTAAYVAGAIASTVYCLPRVLRIRGQFHASEVRSMFKYAWPLMGSLILLYLSTSAVPLVVNGAVGVGNLVYFNAANGFRILALAIPAAVALPLFPHLAGLHTQQKYSLIRDRTWKSLRLTAMLLAPVAVALVVYRSPVLSVFYNSSFVAPASIPLALLVISAIPLALSQLIGTSLSAVGYQRLELYLTTLMVVVMFAGFGLLLVGPRLFGLPPLTAVAAAVLASSIAAFGLNVYFMNRLLAIHLQPRPILTILFAAGVSFSAVALLNRYVSTWSWYVLFAAFVLGTVVYAFVLAAVGELSREDVELFGNSLGLPAWAVRLLGHLCWRALSPPVNPVPPGSGLALRPLLSEQESEEPPPPFQEPPTR